MPIIDDEGFARDEEERGDHRDPHNDRRLDHDACADTPNKTHHPISPTRREAARNWGGNSRHPLRNAQHMSVFS